MANFAIGRYVPYNSFLHRLDARSKVAMTIFLMIAVFMDYPTWSMRALVGGVIFLFLLILLYISKMKISSILSSLKSMWFMIIFLLLIYILVPKANNTLGIAFKINDFVVYWDSFAEAFRIIMRLVMMIMITMILTATTRPLDLTFALEWYLYPLRIVHFPVSEIAMMLSIALRFIPTLLDDADRIMKAQASRGVDFKHGKIKEKILGITSLIIPLFVSSFVRSDELASAMECRGYDPREKRSRYRQYKFYIGDVISIIFVVAFVAGVMSISILNFDVFAYFGIAAL
ncbi:MAG TPA: transporter [Firmicutes bacterium]|nr:transporter [Bacillota bacterium]